MTAEQAVEILNRHEHHGHAKWYARGEFVSGPDQYENFNHFEAIAIAEKLDRDDPKSAFDPAEFIKPMENMTGAQRSAVMDELVCLFGAWG